MNDEMIFDELSPRAPFPPLRDFESMPRGPIAVIAPHPDDETIGCGGVIALHARRGDRVTVILVTDGASGDRDDATRGRVREVRRREVEAAGAWLGVSAFVGCDLEDGKVRPNELTRESIRRALVPGPWAAIYAPSPFECHPDHLACGFAVAKVTETSKLTQRLFLYEINQPHLPSFLIDITDVATLKRRALTCFASQIRYIDVVGKAMGGSYARTVNIDLKGVQYAEAYREIAPGSYAELASRVRGARDLETAR